ncbi:MurR/RpiR family transcriptional regulator, partial [Hyphococcus sp.]
MKPPKTIEELRASILAKYDSLSKRLQQIAKYVLDEPNDFALETVAVLAERCGVQPSAIVRFAKSFGFDGASQMQKLFRDDLLTGQSSLGYAERIRQFKDQVGKAEVTGPMQILSEFVDSNILALGHLREDILERDLKKVTKLIADCENVYVVGFGRAFPIAAYFAYALSRLNKRTIFIDG